MLRFYVWPTHNSYCFSFLGINVAHYQRLLFGLIPDSLVSELFWSYLISRWSHVVTWILRTSLLFACSSFFWRLSSSRACCCSFCSHLMYSTEAFRMVPLFQRMSLQKEQMVTMSYFRKPPDVRRISSPIKKKMGRSFKAFPPFVI